MQIFVFSTVYIVCRRFIVYKYYDLLANVHPFRSTFTYQRTCKCRGVTSNSQRKTNTIAPNVHSGSTERSDNFEICKLSTTNASPFASFAVVCIVAPSSPLHVNQPPPFTQSPRRQRTGEWCSPRRRALRRLYYAQPSQGALS
uniref:Secreted protein n=1 Tax=Steinernema glaseri TaxID=37863 RepID=A0A1I7ZB09_9BILA